MKNKITAMTRISAVAMLFYSSLTMSRMKRDWSPSTR